MIELTNLEKITLDDITKDCFYQFGLDSVIWADCFMDSSSLGGSVVRGVLSSLIKKNIIYPITKGRDGQIKFKEFGKQIMRELGYK
jgi:hypothetical protein